VSTSPALSLQVIVGKAVRRTRTPIFIETMDHVIFRPFWNVPASILREEVLPRVTRQPGYLAREQMEIVAGPGDDARVVPVTPDAIERLSAGELRLRQRPGPHNALGLVKFVFPNNEGVYMHGTPTPGLFARDRRDFSHGCIRVSDPPALAAWALADVPGWTAERIAAAMAGDVSTRVDLPEPIDVVLYYITAAVLPDDGQLHFADDIYGHDATLARALARLDARR
jgi:murein L,D-transpeptidase YcbB/YkuD